MCLYQMKRQFTLRGSKGCVGNAIEADVVARHGNCKIRSPFQAVVHKKDRQVPVFTVRMGWAETQIMAGSGSLQVVGRDLAGATVGRQFEGDLLAVSQLAKAGPLDCRDMNENVLVAVVGGDEAVALGCIKPLYCTGRHNDAFLCK